MIYRKRGNQTAKIRHALHGEDGEDPEMVAARAYYNAIPPPTKSFGKFKKYKASVVKEKLEATFYKKCAYCESYYGTVSPMDVEHYRPKGGVSECEDDHPGYWWLAAEWKNLLPSCIDCNRKREHLAYKLEMSAEAVHEARLKAELHKSGKANSFPTKDNKWALSEEEDIKKENALLINPCETDPKNHLVWDFGQDQSKPIWEQTKFIPIVLPAILDNGDDDPYGKASIDVYGLNREELLRARSLVFTDLLDICDTIIDNLNDLNEDGLSAERQEKLLQRLVKNKNKLYARAEPDKPYSAFVTAFIEEFEKQLTEWS